MNILKPLLASIFLASPLAAEKHTSTAVVEIHSTRSYALDPLKESPNFIANEIASMSMGSVITVAAHGLQIEPLIIRNSLKVTRVEGTDFARIDVTLDDQQQAQSIANEVIKSYITLRNSAERDRAEMQLVALDDELTLQGDLVQEHRNELTVLIQQYGIPYFEGDQSFQVGKAENQLYRQEQQRLQRLETEKQKHQAHLHVLTNAAPEKRLGIAAAINIPNNPVARHLKENQTLPEGENHLDQLTAILETNLQITEQEIALAISSVDKLQENAIDLSLKQHNYNQARNDYERALAFYEKLERRQQETRHILKMPKTLLTMHERPE
ncbi:hypothetical protein V2O64_19425 [Verrucomicrobiaceae bacterium 227]